MAASGRLKGIWWWYPPCGRARTPARFREEDRERGRRGERVGASGAQGLPPRGEELPADELLFLRLVCAADDNGQPQRREQGIVG